MPFVIEIDPEAAQDIEAVAQWYDGQRTGLGDTFLSEVNALLSRLAERPLAFPSPPGHPTVRQSPLRRFPYRLLFEVANHHVYVVACSHVRQRPDWWAERLGRHGPND
jgi:toxin ParE1/3/4